MLLAIYTQLVTEKWLYFSIRAHDEQVCLALNVILQVQMNVTVLPSAALQLLPNQFALSQVNSLCIYTLGSRPILCPASMCIQYIHEAK